MHPGISDLPLYPWNTLYFALIYTIPLLYVFAYIFYRRGLSLIVKKDAITINYLNPFKKSIIIPGGSISAITVESPTFRNERSNYYLLFLIAAMFSEGRTFFGNRDLLHLKISEAESVTLIWGYGDSFKAMLQAIERARSINIRKLNNEEPL